MPYRHNSFIIFLCKICHKTTHKEGHVCPSVRGPARTVGKTGKELQKESIWVEAFDGTVL